MYAQLVDATSNFTLLDLVPDTHAWLKDPAGTFVHANRLFLQRFGFHSAGALAGKTDHDLAPPHLAQQYIRDDGRVLAGTVVTDRLELISGVDRDGDWFLTSKWPVYDKHNHIIGTLGISRHLNRTEGTTFPFQQLRAPVDYIHQHFSQSLSVADLARACNLSISALERRFRRHLNKTPHQYISEVRLSHARALLLDTDKSIGSIALEAGFADHSHFTRAFKKQFGVTPRTARAQPG